MACAVYGVNVEWMENARAGEVPSVMWGLVLMHVCEAGSVMGYIWVGCGELCMCMWRLCLGVGMIVGEWDTMGPLQRLRAGIHLGRAG